MKTPTFPRFIALLCVSSAISLHVRAQQWSGGDIGNSENWSDGLNWVGGAAPNSGGVVIFPDGAFPVTTNTQGTVNNIVQGNMTISSLTYNNNSATSHFVTTQIPTGNTLTVSGNVTAGGTVATTATVTGGGSLVAGGGSGTLSVQSTSGTATLDLSPLTNFVFNAGGGSSGAVTLSTGSSSASGKINLAAASNNITAGTLSLGNNNNGGSGTMNLGNGTNVINADTISLGIDKTTGTMQFLNSAGGGLKIANHTGTGRANINLSGQSGSGSTSANINGSMLFNGGTVNILANNLIVGNRGNRAASGANGSATGVLQFNNGVVDATTIIMATNSGGGARVSGTISVGGPGLLRVGTGGIVLVNQGSSNAVGTLNITNGATVVVTNSMFKGTSTGVATVVVANSSLAVFGSIGANNGITIDNFNVTNATLTLACTQGANVLLNSFNPDATSQNTINISSMPAINGPFPEQFPLITYATAAGNLNSLVLGTLPGPPGTFTGYISNNVNSSSIDLVITSGPISKSDTWIGEVNSLWDSTTTNWLSSGQFTNYNDLDVITFDDTASNSTVNITGPRIPATASGLTFNNNTLNYTFSGVGSINGAVGLVKNDAASVTLSESGGDSFSGGIDVTGGTLVLDDANSTITGGLTISSGTTVQIGNNDSAGALPGGTLDDEGTLVFDRANNLTVGTAIPGSGGAVVQNGTGILTFSAANTYSGATTVNRGTLALSGGGSIADSPNVNVTNATLDVSGVTTSAIMAAVAISNTVVNVKVGYLQTNFNVSSLSMSGPSDTINVKSLPSIAVYPATNGLIQSSTAIVGNNFVLGTLPTASPAYAGSITLSSDATALLLVLTAGPVGVRPTVTWSGVDAQNGMSTNWSDAQNWQSPGAPIAAEKVVFNDDEAVGGSVLGGAGQGPGGITSPAEINNIVDINSTNAGLNYANAGNFHNTLINPGKALLVNGSLTISGASGTATIFGTNGTLTISNTANSSVLNVENASAPTLDLSGLDSFAATVNQIGVGFNSGSQGSRESGIWYMAKTNTIVTGAGSSGVGSAMVVGGCTSQNSSGTGTVYLGQTNIFFIDGIVLGVGPSSNNLVAFNPAVTNNSPGVYIRGNLGNSSRVSQWSLGDDTVNVNNNPAGTGETVDFTGGSLNALVNTLIVGQGGQGNNFTTSIIGTFTMGAGNLDVTTLTIGVGDNGKNGGTGIGIMNVTGGTLVANILNLAVSSPSNTQGTLNMTNATLVLSNGITVGAGNDGGTLSVIGSKVSLLNGTVGSTTVPLTVLNLDTATLQIPVNATAPSADIVAGNVDATNLTTIDITAVANVTGSAQIPLISYTNSATDPYTNLVLGTIPAGYTVGNSGALVDNTVNQSVDIILNAVVSNPTTNANITHVSLSGTNLIIQGTNNNVPNTSFHYAVLVSTNIATPLTNWTILSTNPFNADGTFDYTNPVVPGMPRQFIDVQAVP